MTTLTDVNKLNLSLLNVWLSLLQLKFRQRIWPFKDSAYKCSFWMKSSVLKFISTMQNRPVETYIRAPAEELLSFTESSYGAAHYSASHRCFFLQRYRAGLFSILVYFELVYILIFSVFISTFVIVLVILLSFWHFYFQWLILNGQLYYIIL